MKTIIQIAVLTVIGLALVELMRWTVFEVAVVLLLLSICYQLDRNYK